MIARTKPSRKAASAPPAEDADLPWDEEELEAAESAAPPRPGGRGLWGALVRRGAKRRRGRVFLFIVALLVIAVAGVVFVLGAGGTDFGALRGRIKQTIEANIGPGYTVEVGKTWLGVDPVLGLAVTVDDIIIRDPSKSIAADIPSTRLAIDAWSLLSQRGLIRAVEVNGATLLFSRSADGRVQLGEPAHDAHAVEAKSATEAASPETAGAEPAAAEAGTTGGFPDLFAALQILDRGIDPAIATALNSGFERFAMSNSTLSIKDARESQPRLFLRTELGALFEPAARKVTITFATSGYAGRWTANAERTIDPKTGERTLSATFSQLTLADLFPIFGQENSAVSSDIPLYGRSTVRLAQDGAVTDATLRLDAGSGAIRFRTEQDYMLIDEATLRLRWDVPNDLVIVDQSTVLAGQTRALINGWIRPLGDTAERKYQFNFESQGAVLAPRDSPELPLLTQRISVSGTADLPGKLVQVENAMILSPAGNVSASGSIGFEARTPSLAMAANFSPMPVAALKQMWPPFLAGGARRWVMSHVQGGNLVSGRIEAAIPGGLLWTGKRVRVPDDAFRMDFRMEDVSFTTIGTVPAVTKASGNGSLVGSTFGLDIESGEVVTDSGKRATISNGVFAIPDLVPRYPEARVELQMTGDAGAFGDIANAEPFRALSRRDIDPSGFAGSAKASLSATWPLQPGVTEEDLGWRVRVDVTGFSSDKPIEGHTVSDGTVTIVVDRDVAAISGKAMIDGVPAAVSLAEPMSKEGAAPSADGRRQIRLALGGAGNQRLGGLDDIVIGTITATVTDLPGKTGTRYDIDLTRARLVLTFLGWTKGIGVPARLTFDLTPSGSTYKVEKINLSGTGFSMTGDAVVDKDYAIRSASIGKLALRKGDNVSLTLKRDKGASIVTVRGSQFDLRGLVAQARSPDEFRNSIPDISVDAKIDTVIGNNNEVLKNASLMLRTRGGAVTQVDLKGSLSNTPLTASYVDDERGGRVSMTSTDAGKFFRFVDLYTRGIGGQIRLAGQTIGPDGPLTGVFDVTNFAVLNEPAMQSVVAQSSAGRPAQAASTQFDPRRVPFDRMLINFTKRDTVLVIDDAMLAGPALGANLTGSIDFANSRLNFAGTYIPAYAFNNFFGKIPVLGIILGGGSREGLFGVTFKVDGSLSDPRLTVNALSAITPGIFRKIFEFQQSTPARSGPVYPNAPIPQ